MQDFQLKNITHSEIIDLLDSLAIDPEKKEEFGEVPTPVTLIDEMLDRLPKSIWKDHNRKWLDPATGIGSFQILVYERLMKGLQSWEPNLEKRHDHIIRSMLYMAEINPASVKKVKKIFGPSTNIIQGDFLKHDFSTTKFDIILGNPPFNKGQNIEEEDGKRGSGNPIWIEFVEKSLDLLAPSGFLLFVHPSGWRKPTTESSKTEGLFKKMAHDRQIEYLEIHDKADGVKFFGVQTRYDWYLLENRPCNKKTVVKDEMGKIQKIDFRKWSFLPNCYFSEIRSLLVNPKSNKSVEVIYSRNQFGTDRDWVSEKESAKYKYPLIHSTPKLEDGPRIFWTSTMEPPVKDGAKMFRQPKVIFGESGIHEVVLDADGKYGLTQGAIGIKINGKKQGLLMKKYLESDEFGRIIKAMNFGNFRIDWRIFLYFRRDFYNFRKYRNKPGTRKRIRFNKSSRNKSITNKK